MEEFALRRMVGIEAQALVDLIHDKLGKFTPDQERHFNRAMAYSGEIE